MVKKLLLLAASASAGALALIAPAASAAPWQNISQRQAQLDHRIDEGVRTGSLTQSEAWRLRGEFKDLTRLEARYRQHGLTGSKRSDLDRRFDTLSRQIRDERHDADNRNDRRGDRWIPINQREHALFERIDAGERDRSLSRRGAMELRKEFKTSEVLEASYRRNGLTASERASLDTRMDRLSGRIYAERSDGDRHRG